MPPDGYYWARADPDGEYEPVEVWRDADGVPYSSWIVGCHVGATPILEIGPRLTPPDNPRQPTGEIDG